MGTKSCTKILTLPKIFPTRNVPSWQNLGPRFEIAAVTEILGRRDKSIVQLLSTENCIHSKKNAHSMYGGDCDAEITKAAAAVTRVQSQSQEVGSGNEGRLLVF